MKLQYLNNNSWSEITREERYFCAELYQLIQLYGVNEFVKLLNKQYSLNLDSSDGNNWQIGYEVCFYRDVFYNLFKKNSTDKQNNFFSLFDITSKDIQKYKKSKNPAQAAYKAYLKRTFDLCLMSEKEIVIIEARAHQGFDKKQMENMCDDRIKIKNYVEEKGEIKKARVLLIGLTSSNYSPRQDTKNKFDLLITWKNLLATFPKDPAAYKLTIDSNLAALKRANDTFEHAATNNFITYNYQKN